MLHAVYFDEDLIDVECIALSLVPPFQTREIDGAEFNAPKSDRFPADHDPPLSKYIFNIPMTEIESEIQPNSVADDIWRESVTLVSIHPPILPIWGS